MKAYGVDSRQSWISVFACTLIFITTAGLFIGSSGVLFIAIMDANNYSKEDASWPFTIFSGMGVVSGIFCTLLNARFSERAIILFGVMFFTVGSSACFFSTNLYYLCLIYGGLGGTGVFISAIVVPALINNSFKNHRATAMGIVFSGIPFATMIFPAITNTILETFGLQGTFLLIGGISLQATVGAIALVENKEFIINITKANTDISDKCGNASQNVEPEKGNSIETRAQSEIEAGTKKIEISQGRFHKGSIIRILKNRGFHLSNFTQILFYFLSFLFNLVIIDFSRDKGIPFELSMLLIPIFASGQILGRVVLGWLSDKNILSKPANLLLLFTMVSFVCFTIPYVFSFVKLACLTAFYGLIVGNLATLSNVVFSDYIKKEDMVIAMSISRSAGGVASLMRTFVIGGSTETTGSYDGLFYFMGALSVFSAMLWFLEMLCLRRLSLRSKHQLNKSIS